MVEHQRQWHDMWMAGWVVDVCRLLWSKDGVTVTHERIRRRGVPTNRKSKR